MYFIDSVQTLLHVYVDPPFHEDLIVRIEVEAEKLEEDQVVQTQIGAGASAKPDEPVERLRKLWQDFSTLFCWIFLLKNSRNINVMNLFHYIFVTQIIVA